MVTGKDDSTTRVGFFAPLHESDTGSGGFDDV